MEANEIRIGNCVTVDNPKHHPRIKDLVLIVVGLDNWKDKPSVSMIHTNPKENLIIPSYSQFIEFIKPIKLTEELLLNLGFSKGYKKCLYLNLPNDPNNELPFFYVNNRMNVEYVELMDTLESNQIKKIYYVHELQNVYYALTAIELDVKNINGFEKTEAGGQKNI